MKYPVNRVLLKIGILDIPENRWQDCLIFFKKVIVYQLNNSNINFEHKNFEYIFLAKKK
jgi:hypothetical protein